MNCREESCLNKFLDFISFVDAQDFIYKERYKMYVSFRKLLNMRIKEEHDKIPSIPKKQGISLKERTHLRQSEIKRLYVDKGYSQRDVARLMRLSHFTVKLHLKIMGIPTQYPRKRRKIHENT